MPFPGVPAPLQGLFVLALLVVVAMFAWTVLLFARGNRAERRAPATSDELTDRFLWVFMVPALDEAVTIRDSVERLLAVRVSRRRIVVIDDASVDGTDEILATIDHPDLVIMRRELPDARRGKAAALNDAYRRLAPELAGVDPDDVITVIVDADGRLHPDAPRYAAAHFADPRVGGVQSLVRIYNRRHPLTWLQDVEFAVYGHLYQTGRNDWGTAGMGGNGQFNRLSALSEIADDAGPWRDRLTEDQDLGLRLVAAGWKSRQDVRASIAQQGLSRLRPLLRQRTRWSQGGLQALSLTRSVTTSPATRGARLELLVYLLMPFWQGITGAALVAALALWVLDVVPFWGGGPTWMLAIAYLLAFGGTVLGALASRRGRGPGAWLVGLLVGHAYALYTWLIWPVLLRATARHLTRQRAWAKTAREPITTA